MGMKTLIAAAAALTLLSGCVVATAPVQVDVYPFPVYIPPQPVYVPPPVHIWGSTQPYRGGGHFGRGTGSSEPPRHHHPH